jgi:hypothetical protein
MRKRFEPLNRVQTKSKVEWFHARADRGLISGFIEDSVALEERTVAVKKTARLAAHCRDEQRKRNLRWSSLQGCRLQRIQASGPNVSLLRTKEEEAKRSPPPTAAIISIYIFLLA